VVVLCVPQVYVYVVLVTLLLVSLVFSYFVLFLLRVRLGSLPLVLVAGSCGVAFIEHRLSLLVLFIIFCTLNLTEYSSATTTFLVRLSNNIPALSQWSDNFCTCQMSGTVRITVENIWFHDQSWRMWSVPSGNRTKIAFFTVQRFTYWAHWTMSFW
jgi:hypothetical protein